MSNLPFIPTSEINEQPTQQGEYRSPLGLDKLLISRPASTFLLRAGADRYGVRAGDILVVDRSLPPRRSQLVVVPANGDLILAKYPAAEVWGVVTYVIHDCNRG